MNDTVDVSSLFNSALTMVFAYHLVDSVRNTLAILYVVFGLHSAFLERTYEFLAANCLLGIATLVMIHERFSDYGKICSTAP